MVGYLHMLFVCSSAARKLMSLAVAVLIFAPASTWGSEFQVGFRKIELNDSVTGLNFPIAVWYPSNDVPKPLAVRSDLSRCQLPLPLCEATGAYVLDVALDGAPTSKHSNLIVISHGAGGGGLNHWSIALALARAGYVVAAPSHPVVSYKSGSAAWIGRPKQISETIDRLLSDEKLGPLLSRAVGVVGHSNGGYTALALVGARPSTSVLVAHCNHPPAEERKFCDYGGSAGQASADAGIVFPDLGDPRVRAIVLMAPVAALFSDEELAAVAVPARIYGAQNDDLTPIAFHAKRVADLVKGSEYVLVRNANHYSFISTFPAVLKLIAGESADDAPGFDRSKMLQMIGAEIVQFFAKNLDMP